MAGSACDAIVLILSVTHGGADIPMAVGWLWRYSTQRVIIRAQGVTGPSCRPIVGRDVVATIRHLNGPSIAPDTSGSLVMTGIDGDGDSHAITITTMLADGFGQSVDVNAPPGSYDQDFVHKGNMSSNPVSGS